MLCQPNTNLCFCCYRGTCSDRFRRTPWHFLWFILFVAVPEAQSVIVNLQVLNPKSAKNPNQLLAFFRCCCFLNNDSCQGKALCGAFLNSSWMQVISYEIHSEIHSERQVCITQWLTFICYFYYSTLWHVPFFSCVLQVICYWCFYLL